VLCQITFEMSQWKTLCKSLIRKELCLHAPFVRDPQRGGKSFLALRYQLPSSGSLI